MQKYGEYSFLPKELKMNCESMRLNFQERSELKIQKRIDPLENSWGSPGHNYRRLRREGSFFTPPESLDLERV